MKATLSAGVADWLAYRAIAGVGSGLGRDVSQSLVVGLLVPVITSLSWNQTSADALSNVTVQPASQSCPMEMRLVFPRAGNMWACLAASGSWGMWRVAVWVDTMWEPSGCATWMPLLVGCMLEHSSCTERKCPVVPVSSTALVGGNGSINGGVGIGIGAGAGAGTGVSSILFVGGEESKGAVTIVSNLAL